MSKEDLKVKLVEQELKEEDLKKVSGGERRCNFNPHFGTN